jgi:hypothetical protein
MAIHLFGAAASPWLIGVVSDRIGLTIPVLVTGCLLAIAGVILLLGRAGLERDMRRLGEDGARSRSFVSDRVLVIDRPGGQSPPSAASRRARR